MVERCVNIYERQGKVLIVPLYRIDGGGYVEKGPVHVLDAEAWQAVGEAILEALAAYEEGFPMPNWNSYVPVAKNAIGVSTEDEFEQGLKGCFLRVGTAEILVTPDETKIGRGLIPLSRAEFRVPLTSDPQILGEIVRKGLAIARG